MRIFPLLPFFALTLSASASDWFVRPNGGTRYSTNVTTGQCDGTANVDYPGTGVNQHCAFKDVRYFWQDGSNPSGAFPAYGWIGAGGDRYIIGGSIADGISHRIGTDYPNTDHDGSGHYFGNGVPSNGMPPPLNGTSGAHTQILGANYAACSAQSARAQLHGGYGVYYTVDMRGAQYVDVQCMDITDFSSCGRNGQTNTCDTSSTTSESDFSTIGIGFTNASTHDTLTNVRVHGMGSTGIYGPTGDQVNFNHVVVTGNPGSGWNSDDGSGNLGVGTTTWTNYEISWNGCAEEYPIVDALPYKDCADDVAGGYGDGFGSASKDNTVAWNVIFDQGVVMYNTQDGLDGLHLNGAGSSMTVTRTLAYGNMGNQLKLGGVSGVMQNDAIIGNCYAMSTAIPGTPSGYNSRLTDFCRGADTAAVIELGPNATAVFDDNTVFSAGTIGLQVNCQSAIQGGVTTQETCDSTSKIDYRNNVFVGFTQGTATGYPSGSANAGINSTPIYDNVNGVFPSVHVFQNSGSFYSNNLVYHPKSSWTCPAAGETNALCVDPSLTDETYHLYGFGNMAPASGTSAVVGHGVTLTGVSLDLAGLTRPAPPAMGAYDFFSSTGVTPVGGMQGNFTKKGH